MSRTVYVNGEFVAEENAQISVFDRGFLFADAVYEVSSVIEGKLLDNDRHLARLRRSLGELNIPSPASDETITGVQKELIKRNELVEGAVYMQVTRGAADRDFAFPANAVPGMVLFTQAKQLRDSPQARDGIAVVTMPDIRWKRRDIKTVGLLAQSMAKQAALDAGATDAWMVEDGFVTEGSSNNAFIVDKNGCIITRQLGNDILHGITRASVLKLTQQHNIALEERAFTVAEALDAQEAFLTSASTFVWPVISIDGHPIGDGKPGAVAGRLRELYIETALQGAV
ncbi:D-amino acid aminotransferase [Chromatiales bacterium (ex Bugula neritina AB1)]|nr:D-amino acid aminotransferase [Chromatiales bacterium (ex Bugula neritina AB1)]